MSNPDTGRRLAEWRASQDKNLTKCAEAAGVRHPTWLDWERGSRNPSLEKACAIEKMTGGAIPVEAWGFKPTALDAMRDVVRLRNAADRRAKRALAPSRAA